MARMVRRAGVVVEPFAAGFHDASRVDSSVCVEGLPSDTSMSGFTSSICRWMNGRQICVSCGVGVRLPGGRQGITLAI